MRRSAAGRWLPVCLGALLWGAAAHAGPYTNGYKPGGSSTSRFTIYSAGPPVVPEPSSALLLSVAGLGLLLRRRKANVEAAEEA